MNILSAFQTLMAEGKKECWKVSVSDYQFSWLSSCVDGLVVDFIHFEGVFSGLG